MAQKKESILAYYCSSKSWGGLEMNQLKNANWLHQRGFQVVVFAPKDSKLFQEAQQLEIQVEEIEKPKKYFDFINASRLARKIKNRKITHLVVRDPRDMDVCAWAKIFSFNSIFLTYFMEMQLGINKRDFIHTFRFRRFDLWVCPLKWLQFQVEKKTRFPLSRTKIIPSGVDLFRFFESPSKKQSKELLDLSIDKQYIGLIGRFDPQKGQRLLLESFNKIKDQIPHDLLFLGEPTYGENENYVEELNAFCQQEELTERVHFRPFRKDVEVFYSAIDVFVMASTAESIGMVTIEAMASGCRIVGSDTGGTPELLKNEEFGALFRSGEVQDLADKLLSAINDHTFTPQKLKEAVLKFRVENICEIQERAMQLN